MNINNKPSNLDSIKISIASPEIIKSWSSGEVTKPETINYKSLKPERDGLFCERIFGPAKDYECACGKYKKIKNEGIICERCGVQVTKKIVRRSRFGHIELQAPVAHIWFLKTNPSRLSNILDMRTKELEEIIYFVSYVVIKSGDSDFQVKEIIDPIKSRKKIKEAVLKIKEIIKEKNDSDEIELCDDYIDEINNSNYIYNYEEIFDFIGQYTGLKIGIGANAILELLEQVDLVKEIKLLKQKILKIEEKNGDISKAIKRLDIISKFASSGNKPEWMVMKVLPIIPPDLRPIIPLDGGRFTTSDINDLYRRIIIRNERLRKIISANSPTIIINNEKRMLQEAVDALIDNQKKAKPLTGKNKKRIFRSLSDSLKGKKGRFRQNLLGKRVDYSGRSVIVVGPKLKMYECGLPKDMALSIFKPYIIEALITKKHAQNIKIAENMIIKKNNIIWDILEEIIKDHPILLNRAPTLHRLGIQAFIPKLTKGKAIELHPLSTPAFNADFDGDQMAVHLPLSNQAINEARSLMIGSKNILSLKDASPIVTPTQDMILGLYYLTKENKFNIKITIFYSYEEVYSAYENEKMDIHDVFLIKIDSLFLNQKFPDFVNKNIYLITTYGKLIFNHNLPPKMLFLNNFDKIDFISKDNLVTFDPQFQKIANYCNDLNSVKKIINNRKISHPITKKSIKAIIAYIFDNFNDECAKILDQIKTIGFKYSTESSVSVSLFDCEFLKKEKNNSIDVIKNFKSKLITQANKTVNKVDKLYNLGYYTKRERHIKIVDLWTNVRNNVQNFLNDYLSTSDMQENSLFMMIDSGARGNISNLTQLTGMRGLMSNPKGEIIEMPITASFRDGLSILEFFISTHGARKGMADVALKTADSGYLTRKLIDVAQNVTITTDDCHVTTGSIVKDIIDNKTNDIIVPLYDRIVGRFTIEDISDNKDNIIVKGGELITVDIAKKIIAANIEKVHIRSVLKCKAPNDGICQKCYGMYLANKKIIDIGSAVGIIAAQSIGEPGTQLTMRTFHTGGIAGQLDITQGLPRVKELLDITRPKSIHAKISSIYGIVEKIIEGDNFYQITIKNEINVNSKHKMDVEVIKCRANSRLRVKKGDRVVPGQKITDGAIILLELLKIAGRSAVEKYILKEIQRVYRLQGIEISDKYIEIIIRQMLSKVKIINSGDTKLVQGSLVDINDFLEVNKKILLKKQNPASAEQVILGIKKASLKTKSFFSAASFQDTTSVLTNAASCGEIDNLRGLKENVIIGNKIPVGTGLLTDEELEQQAKMEKFSEY